MLQFPIREENIYKISLIHCMLFEMAMNMKKKIGEKICTVYLSNGIQQT